jgi:hypothetical protein
VHRFFVGSVCGQKGCAQRGRRAKVSVAIIAALCFQITVHGSILMALHLVFRSLAIALHGSFLMALQLQTPQMPFAFFIFVAL